MSEIRELEYLAVSRGEMYLKSAYATWDDLAWLPSVEIVDGGQTLLRSSLRSLGGRLLYWYRAADVSYAKAAQRITIACVGGRGIGWFKRDRAEWSNLLVNGPMDFRVLTPGDLHPPGWTEIRMSRCRIRVYRGEGIDATTVRKIMLAGALQRRPDEMSGMSEPAPVAEHA